MLREAAVPITYNADLAKVEYILLKTAHFQAPTFIATKAKKDMQDRFGVEPIHLDPRVFFRVTNNRGI